jgi:hypothetical protein
MPRSIARFFPIIIVAIAAPSMAYCQFIEGIDLSSQPLPSGSRGQAMAGSLIAVPGGIASLEYNPAALAPLESNEFSFSVFNRDHASTALFFGNSSDNSLSRTSISSLGLAAPYPVTQGHLAIGISFNRVRDYTSTYSFSAVNRNSSLFNTKGFITTNGIAPYYGDSLGTGNRQFLGNYNIAYALGLTNQVPDSGAFMLSTPFNGGLQQSGTVTQEGGLNAVRIGAGIDIAEGIAAGATINLFFGSLDYTRVYRETDVNGIFAHDLGTIAPAKFQSAEITDILHEGQTGGNLKLGLLIDKLDLVRFGLTLETPTLMHIDETADRTGIGNFPYTTYTFPNLNGATSSEQIYDIVTPMRLSAGASFHLLGLTTSAGVSYANMSQLRFTNSDLDMSALNDDARNLLRSVLSWQLGAEYAIPGTGINLRAGYADEPSSYKGDPSSFDTKSISGGLGVLLGKSLLIEGAWRHSTYHTNHSIYNDYTLDGKQISSSITDDAVHRDDISVTFNYRY